MVNKLSSTAVFKDFKEAINRKTALKEISQERK